MSRTRVTMLLAAAALLAAGAATAQQAAAPAAQPDLAPRVARAAARIAALDQRAGRIADYNQLRNLQQAYGYYVDKAMWDEVTDLFTDDGTLEIGQHGVYAGKAAIRRYLYSLTGGRPGLLSGQLNNQFQLSPVITLAADGGSAKARWRTLVQDGLFGAGSGGNWGAGVYENEYAKEAGRWKIRRLHLFVRFYAPYEGGWTRTTAQQNARFGRSGVRPTRPPSVSYGTFPERHTAPFHYANPGTDGYRLAPAPAAPAGSSRTVAELEAQVRALELKLDRLKSFDDVERLEGIYGYYADKSMQDAISALFAENATLEILGRGVFVGRDRVYEYMRRLGVPTFGTLFNHMQLQPVVHVSDDGGSANIRARLFVMYGAEGRGAQWGEGVYENRFVRENGTWKYQSLNGHQTFYTNYEDGWARKSQPMMSPFPGYPPDLPQSVDYQPYPALYTPPFHYRHPVTGK